MGIFDKLKFGRKNKSLFPGKTYRPFVYMDGKVIKTSSYVSASSALNNSDLYSVINLISADVSSCTFQSSNEFVKHKLNAPNPLLNSYNFWQTVVAQLLIDGNAYVVMHFEHDELSWFEHVTPGQVQISLYDGSKNMDYTVTYADKRGSVTIPSSQMLHFKLMGNAAKTQYLGVSPLQSLIVDLNIQDKANQMALSSLSGAINPSSIIQLKEVEIDEKAKENIRNAFEAANSGDNGGRPLVLDGGMSYTAAQVDAGIAKLLDSVTYTRIQVAKAFGVPQDFLNSESAHSNIDQVRSTYSQSLNKYIYAITSELTMKLGVGVDMDISSAIDPDHHEYVNKIDTLVKDNVLDSSQGVFLLQKIGFLPSDLPERQSSNDEEIALKGGENSET